MNKTDRQTDFLFSQKKHYKNKSNFKQIKYKKLIVNKMNYYRKIIVQNAFYKQLHFVVYNK